MRMMMFVSLPVEPFNTAVKDGSAGAKMQKILGAQKPEAAYFMDLGGKRTGVLVVDLASASQIPALAEPWFLTFNASIEMHPAMTPADLGAAGLDKLGKEWG
jgi:hypothetical protein